MLTSRDRRRFERVAARAMRPSRRVSLSSVVSGLSGRSIVAGITLIVAALGVAGVYASRSSIGASKIDLAVGGKPAEQPAPVQEAEPTRQADVQPVPGQQARAPEARLAHLRQLQPVLRTDAERLAQVARRVRAEARVTDARKDRSENAVELRSIFTAHRVLSADLANHYQDYSQAKERLRKSVADQEDEYSQTASMVASQLSLPPAAEQRRPEVTWAILERCLGKGPGMTLTTRPDGYQYTVRGRTQRYGGGASVAEDEGAAFAAFTSFAAEPQVTAHCDSMKKRAAAIVLTADKLASDALALAEQTTLPGDCKYTKPD
jgi:hypothetical protein